MNAALLKSSAIGLALACSAAVYADTTSSVIPVQTPGFGVSITGLYLQPSANNLEYAIFTNPLPLPAPNWQQQTVKPNYSGAFDLGVQYNLVDGTDQVRLDWLHFNSSDSAAAYSDGPGTSVGPTYYYGPSEQFLLNTSANSTVKFNVDNVNLVFGHLVNLTNNIQIEPFVGVSTAYLKEDITDNYAGADPVYGPYYHNVYETSTFTGFGPRLGLDASYFVTNHFGVTAEMAGSLLLGTLNSNTNFTSWTAYTGGNAEHNNTPTNTTMADESQNEIVPEIDGKLGVIYAIPFNNSGSSLTLQAGYMFAAYINAINQVVPSTLVPTSWEAGSVAIVNQTEQQSDLDLNGPYVSLAWKF